MDSLFYAEAHTFHFIPVQVANLSNIQNLLKAIMICSASHNRRSSFKSTRYMFKFIDMVKFNYSVVFSSLYVCMVNIKLKYNFAEHHVSLLSQSVAFLMMYDVLE